MSLNQICSNNNNKFLPEVYLSDLKTDSLELQNSTLSGYVPSNLNVYQEQDYNFTSSGCLSRAVSFSVLRIGKHITLSFEGFNSSPQVATGNGSLNFDSSIPQVFRSDGIDLFPIIVNVAGTDQVGLCQVNSNGNFRIFATSASGSWTAGQLINVYGFSVSYTAP
jgi:hypothetical protein